ncbi:MAG: hypothetical protein E7035_03620 [Verrucomicrobiaceae bacterium]|nr:hypothetical protein [Verrucomicrobiaceae bacterium]
MKLFLLRHATAKETFPDEDRELSDYGVAQVIKLAESVSNNLFENIAQVWHSPFTRARQTSDIFVQKTNLNCPVLTSNEIIPTAYPEEVARMIAGLSCFGADLLIVAHNPLLESLTRTLLGKKQACVTFKTSTMACLNMIIPPSQENLFGEWTLEFLISPEIINK